MNKIDVHRLLLEKLEVDLDVLQRAAQTAYEAATHEENVAENKYDTLGLEASYLATGQARRVEEIRQALKRCQAMSLEPLDPARGIQIGALVSAGGKFVFQRRLNLLAIKAVVFALAASGTVFFINFAGGNGHDDALQHEIRSFR